MSAPDAKGAPVAPDVAVDDPVHVVLAVADPAEGEQLKARLQADHDGNGVTLVTTLAHALKVLADESADACVIDHDVPDGNSLDLLHRAEEEGWDLPVVVLLAEAGEDAAVAIMKAGAADYVRKQGQDGYEDEVAFKVKEAIHHHRLAQQVEAMAEHREQMRLLRTIHSTVATVKHEINNPLSIISGNAQLLVELAKAMELGDDIVQPAQDIEEASQRIASSLDKLADLKQAILDQYTSEQGRT